MSLFSNNQLRGKRRYIGLHTKTMISINKQLCNKHFEVKQSNCTLPFGKSNDINQRQITSDSRQRTSNRNSITSHSLLPSSPHIPRHSSAYLYSYLTPPLSVPNFLNPLPEDTQSNAFPLLLL